MKAWRNFTQTWKHQSSMQIATLSVLLGTFTVQSVFALVHQNLESILTRWGREVKVSVYLKDEAVDADVNKVRTFLQESDMVGKVDFLSKDAAVQKFREKLGQISPGMFADEDFVNPLPASFELLLKKSVGGSADYNTLVSFAKKISGFTGVEEVSYGQGWIENYASVLKVFSWTSNFLLFVLLMGGLFIIGNSIRSSVAQRKDEIAILELFGATKWMVQWPFIFEGALTGFVASTLSIAATYALFQWQADILGGNLGFWGFTSGLKFLSATRVTGIIGLGTVIGAMGAYFCVRQMNTGWAAAEASDR